MNMKYLLTAISLFVLTSCGGGGGGGGAPAGGAPAASNFNGVAVDGYLYQARAFLDSNGNGQYDNGEPTATTDANGAFTLSATQDQINSHSVVVTAIAGTTIDQDNPNTPLASGMTLVAPAGNPSVVSPLTTQVSAKMAGGLSLADAKSAVQTELGLPNIDVMKNFVAEKATNAAYADAHKVAASVAEVLKNIETQSSANTTLANRFSSLTTTVTSQVAPNVTQIKAAASVDDAKTVMTTAISQSVNIYSIGGSISGLTASGLVLANGVGTVSPNSGANSFTFSSRKASGAAYAVTVQSNPTGQICTVSNGSGTVGSQSITNVAISCSNTPGALGGAISGLTTSGLVLKNGSDELTVASGSSTFQFSSTVADGTAFSVTVKTQPTGKTCSISSGTGTMASAGFTSVQVTCAANSYAISGSISGLTASGLKLKNGSEVLTVSSGSTSFALSTQVAYGGTYAVTVDTQPTGKTCSLSNASGTMGAANVTAAQVTCSTNAYTLGGAISGLTASGLKLKNGSEVLTVSSGSTSFALSTQVAYGGTYAVTVDTQPTYPLGCSVLNGAGINVSADISNIAITCAPIEGATVLFAGTTQRNDPGNLDGTGTAAKFKQPAGLAVDVYGSVYVADSGNESIRKISTSGVVTTIAGSGTSGAVNATGTAASFGGPNDVAMDASGNLYVADSGNHLIRKISSTGAVTTLAGTAGVSGSTNGIGTAATFNIPYGLTVDGNGNVYVADFGNNLIRKISASGVVTTIAGSGTSGAVNATGTAASFDGPSDVAIDSSGNLYVTETRNKLIRKISSTGAVTTLAGTAGVSGSTNGIGTAAKFNNLIKLAIDSSGNLYASDTGNNQIRLINTSTGEVSLYVGSGVLAGDFSEGDRTSVYLNSPVGVAVDAAGKTYISNVGSHQILKVYP
jgi:sugar lactone lactonase YvrE/RNase P/RNase MRP subunit p29